MISADTIAAISTPPGISAIAVVRMSGPDAFAIAARVFKPRRAGDSPERARPWSAKVGHILDAHGDLVDEVILLSMPGPYSYTREDMVEITCHGGAAAPRAVLDILIQAGARLAGPGEFTKRAFLNGRIDLSEAETVLAIIASRTEQAMRSAASFMSGRLGECVRAMRQRIINLIALIEAGLDYPEDDLDAESSFDIAGHLREIGLDIDGLIEKASRTRVLVDGLKVAIVGKPNVGKSSLLNAILGEDRAIVAQYPGTTRDTVEETAGIRGIPIRLVDTAGLRDTADPVESQGVSRARAALEAADIVLMVIDGSEPLGDDDANILSATPRCRTIVVQNKLDLPAVAGSEEVMRFADGRKVCQVSALTGEGVNELEGLLETMIQELSSGHEAETGTASRWISCLKRARTALSEAGRAAESGAVDDLVCIDLRAGLDALGDLTGETTREDIIDQIFANFCIGK